tara:strand:+ start:267 stop:974 length:708 start_codon:yes stop_codon:yes gene_type:complete
MALPKLETKTYTLTLPSTGEDIKFRPFLVKEQKILLMAQESKNTSEIADAMSQLISDCTFGKVDPKTCPMFDAEYIFLKLRAKSVGETAQVQITCPDDDKTKVNVTINLEEVECNMTEDHTNIVEVTDNIKIIFNYPLLSTYQNNELEEDKTKKIFSMLVECIQEIHHGDKVYNRIDVSKKELNEFIDSFDTTQFKKVSNFFETMPRLRHIVEVTNPETKVKSEVPIEGLASFLV